MVQNPPTLQLFSPTVRRVDDSTMMKCGSMSTILREVEAIQFVTVHTDIPIPKILSHGRDDLGRGFFAMTIMPGEPISATWHKIEEAQRISIIADLKDYINQLRSLKQPNPGWIGSCTDGPALDQRINNGKPFGPLSSERAFNDLLLGGLHEHGFLEREAMYRSFLREDHKMVFTHGDLSGNNILVANGRVTAILDWQTAGWMPEYWEYRKSRYGENYKSWWLDIVHAFMEPYEREWQVDSDLEWC